MALSATKLFPKSPEVWPIGGGIFGEIWQLLGDGADTTVDVTPDSFKKIVAATAGASTNNVTASMPSTVTFTFATALGNTLTQQAIIYGKV